MRLARARHRLYTAPICSLALSSRRSLLCSFPSFRYCCTGSGQHGTHSYNDGKCDLAPPDQCACYDDVKTKSDGSDDAKAAITAAAAAAAPKPALPQVAVAGTEGRQLSEDCLIDVSSPPEGGYQCTGPAAGNDGMGCFNGWCASPPAAAAAQILPARKFSAPQISLRAKSPTATFSRLPQAVQLHDALPGGHVAPLLRAVRRVPVVAGLPPVPARLVVRAAAADRTHARSLLPRRRHTSCPSLSPLAPAPLALASALSPLPYDTSAGTAARSRARRRATTTRSRRPRASATATAAERLAWPSTWARQRRVE